MTGGQTSNNPMINIKLWRCLVDSRLSLALPHPNSWLVTDFVLLTKIIKYAIFQQCLSHWFVFIEASKQYLKNHGGLMERFYFQPI